MTGAGAWAQLVGSALVPALTALVGWLAGRIRGAAKERRERERESTEERDMTRSAVRLLLFYRLCDLHRLYVVEGQACPIAEKEDAREVYELYHAAGGNGTGTRMYSEIEAAKVA